MTLRGAKTTNRKPVQEESEGPRLAELGNDRVGHRNRRQGDRPCPGGREGEAGITSVLHLVGLQQQLPRCGLWASERPLSPMTLCYLICETEIRMPTSQNGSENRRSFCKQSGCLITSPRLPGLHSCANNVFLRDCSLSVTRSFIHSIQHDRPRFSGRSSLRTRTSLPWHSSPQIQAGRVWARSKHPVSAEGCSAGCR